jgi:hypothetical protein
MIFGAGVLATTFFSLNEAYSGCLKQEKIIFLRK